MSNSSAEARGMITIRAETINPAFHGPAQAMTSISFYLPKHLDHGAAKLYIMEAIISELDRYGIDEILSSLSLRNPVFDK